MRLVDRVIVKVGQALASTTDTTVVIVVRAPDGAFTLTCGGVEMVDAKSATRAGSGAAEPGTMADGTLLGKRYANVSGSVVLLCTKAGAGPLALDGEPLAVQSARPLPASD